MLSKKDVTTPISNKLNRYSLLRSWLVDYQTVRNMIGNPLIKNLQSKLGKQNYCANLGSENRRFWVWEGTSWRICANSTKGLTFEVLRNLNTEQALEAWEDFVQTLTSVKQ